jgi:plasmid rolling circle replication initiator protein Rep
MSSPIMRKLHRYHLRRRSTLATTDAIKDVIPLLPLQMHRWANNTNRRMTTCALSQHIRCITPDNDASRIEVTNRRACKIRICQQCEYRRACKMRNALIKQLEFIWEKHPEARAILVGLTTRNQPMFGGGLRNMLRLHQAGLNRFWKLKRITSVSLGTFSSIELACRGTPDAPMAGIHSHSVFFVPPAYFDKGPAIWQPEFKAMWKQACRLNYEPIVDVRLVSAADGNTDHDAVRASMTEVAKYIVSSETFFTHQNGEISVDGRIALTILAAFHRQRLHRFDRCFAEAAKKARRSSDPA